MGCFGISCEQHAAAAPLDEYDETRLVLRGVRDLLARPIDRQPRVANPHAVTGNHLCQASGRNGSRVSGGRHPPVTASGHERRRDVRVRSQCVEPADVILVPMAQQQDSDAANTRPDKRAAQRLWGRAGVDQGGLLPVPDYDGVPLADIHHHHLSIGAGPLPGSSHHGQAQACNCSKATSDSRGARPYGPEASQG